MSTSFKPCEELRLYCRFCKKTVSAHLERSIADSGKALNKESTYEYVCSKCHRPHCFHGKDIIAEAVCCEEEEHVEEKAPRTYDITEHYLIGERIIHPSHDTVGTIVGKVPGNPNHLLVKFAKSIVKLVEDIN